MECWALALMQCAMMRWVRLKALSGSIMSSASFHFCYLIYWNYVVCALLCQLIFSLQCRIHFCHKLKSEVHYLDFFPFIICITLRRHFSFSLCLLYRPTKGEINWTIVELVIRSLYKMCSKCVSGSRREQKLHECQKFSKIIAYTSESEHVFSHYI